MTGHWTFLNPAWTESTGFAVDQTLGQAWDEYVYPGDQALGRAVFGSLIEGQHTDNGGEIRVRTSSGGIRWMEFFARLTPGPHGTPIGISGTFIDITDRKAAEADRRALEHKLLETQKLESLGVLAGALSLLLFPEPFFQGFEISVLMGLVASIVAGMLVAGFGGVKLLDWQFKFNLERFGAAFCVTLALGVTRFVWFLVALFLPG